MMGGLQATNVETAKYQIGHDGTAGSFEGRFQLYYRLLEEATKDGNLTPQVFRKLRRPLKEAFGGQWREVDNLRTEAQQRLALAQS